MNISARQLNDAAFAGAVHDRLRAHPTLAGRITFEITESATMLNVQSSTFALGSFRRAGIHIAIDDFGTGFSSLSYLKYLPADVIKIDQSFVRGIPLDAKDIILVDTFVWLANAFGFASLAEGIETEEQLSWLREHGCAYGQGFLVSPALPFGEFCAFVRGRGITVSGSGVQHSAKPGRV
jgi:EAL domain-containing protein (putative c-di-GMP-specific phosphodiesterase class I)